MSCNDSKVDLYLCGNFNGTAYGIAGLEISPVSGLPHYTVEGEVVLDGLHEADALEIEGCSLCVTQFQKLRCRTVMCVVGTKSPPLDQKACVYAQSNNQCKPEKTLVEEAPICIQELVHSKRRISNSEAGVREVVMYFASSYQDLLAPDMLVEDKESGKKFCIEKIIGRNKRCGNAVYAYGTELLCP